MVAYKIFIGIFCFGGALVLMLFIYAALKDEFKRK